MGGCSFYTIVNTGSTSDSISFFDCDGIGFNCNLTLNVGETYFVNSIDSLSSGGELAVYNDGLTNDYLDFSGYCGGNFSIGFSLGTTTAFTLNRIYCFSSVTNCDPDIILDLPTQCFKLISSGASPTYQLASIVSNYAYNGVLISECLGFCPCITPTPTPTTTPTPTPTTPTCDTDYCITNTGFDYDDNYQVTGTYDGKDYWVGSTNGYYIYYNSGNTQWCLSNTLGGSCFLFGKSPCTSFCPDLCDEYFNNGICLTPTPTPTINCDVFDFQAIFNCEVPFSPTPTPTNTSTPTTTPTPTPTDVCGYLTLSVTVDTYTPTPTATPTNTPTPSPQIIRPFNFSGDVTFNTLESSIICPQSFKFQDCYNGNLYFTTNSLLLPNGGSLQPFMIFKANVDGEVKCISYLEVDTQTIGVNDIELLEGPVGYSNLGECVFCTPEITKTPTPTPTPTNTSTPTNTPTPTNTSTPTQTTTQTPTMTPTPTNSEICNCYGINDYSFGNTQVTYTNCNTNSLTTVTVPQAPFVSFLLRVCSKTTPTVSFGNVVSISNDCEDCCMCYGLSGASSEDVTYEYFDCDGVSQTITVTKNTFTFVCASVFPTSITPFNAGYVFHPLGQPQPCSPPYTNPCFT